MRKKLLWIGDAACDSGFAKCTHETLPAFREKYDISVLGLNYRGDPHTFDYPIYPAYVPGGDLFGLSRLRDILGKVRPDVVIVQNDPWNVPAYMKRFQALYTATDRPFFVGAIAVDGKNCRGKDLNGLDHVMFWTKFAEDEARAGGFEKTSSVVPLGVNLEQFYPGDRTTAREKLGLTDKDHQGLSNGFFVLNINRNQPRKRLDLTIEYFAQAFHELERPDDLFLYLHVCPTGDLGYNLDQLGGHYGLAGHVILVEPGVYKGSTDDEVRLTYQACNVQVSTTQGEGWGLTTLEGMACGLPQIVPNWSALGEWATAAYRVRCTGRSVTPNNVNVIGGVPNREEFVEALKLAYHSRVWREEVAAAGLRLAAKPEYRWDNIAGAFFRGVEGALARHT